MKIYQIANRAFVFACALIIGITTVAGTRLINSSVSAVSKPAVVMTEQPHHSEPRIGKVVEEIEFNREQENAHEFDPTGSYSLDNEKVPKAFADIKFIDIATREYRSENGKHSNTPVVPNGSIHTSKEIRFNKIAVGDREIAFETQIVNGISYKFVGQFPSSSAAVTCESCEYPADLRGRLIKVKNGKVIAELDADFYLQGC